MNASERHAKLIDAAKHSLNGRLDIKRSGLSGKRYPLVETDGDGQRLQLEGQEYVDGLRELAILGVFYEESPDVFRLESMRPLQAKIYR